MINNWVELEILLKKMKDIPNIETKSITFKRDNIKDGNILVYSTELYKDFEVLNIYVSGN